MTGEHEALTVLAAPDKLRGTATATEAAAAMAAGAEAAGAAADQCPLSDGGEGFLDALGGANRHADIQDALGRPLRAPWRLDGKGAVIETAIVSAPVLAGAPGPEQARQASSAGVGQLIAAAIRAGATEIVLGLGGSAFSDGGFGALEALAELAPLPVQVLVACDVRTGYLDAARVFGPQKGADEAAVGWLTDRLARYAVSLAERFGRDPRDVTGGGAAGGLAGGLYAAGARLEPGFDIVAEHVGLAARIERADLVITAEGRLDETSLDGKVIGGLIQRSSRPVWILAGSVQPGLDLGRARAIDLTDRYGAAARTDTARCLATATRAVLTDHRTAIE